MAEGDLMRAFRITRIHAAKEGFEILSFIDTVRHWLSGITALAYTVEQVRVLSSLYSVFWPSGLWC